MAFPLRHSNFPTFTSGSWLLVFLLHNGRSSLENSGASLTRAGWAELVEMGTRFHHAGVATQQFLAWFAAISQTRGIDASKVAQIGAFLHEAGFSHVKAKTDVIPVGMWGGRIGNLLAQDILAGWPSMRPLAHTLLGVSPEQFDAVIGQLETEWNTLQTTYEVYFAYGQV